MTTATAKAARVRLMGFDVDGVLTDGRLYYGPAGDTLKAFHTLDGHGLKLLARAGIEPIVISGRTSAALARRCAELGLPLAMGIEDKHAEMATRLAARGLGFEAAGYMGDDVVDLPLMLSCGFSAAPADAHELVKSRADWIAPRPGGRGAVRALCDFLLHAQGRWDELLAPYLRAP
jgi:3-deoxy-D-manno-octulosonate 8-phosphate phosphatase (KDO 8-P phosphatase)